jgi:hypothetical protein
MQQTIQPDADKQKNNTNYHNKNEKENLNIKFHSSQLTNLNKLTNDLQLQQYQIQTHRHQSKINKLNPKENIEPLISNTYQKYIEKTKQVIKNKSRANNFILSICSIFHLHIVDSNLQRII